MELGYVYLPDGRLFPVDECGLNIWDVGENGDPPRDYHFTFRAGAGCCPPKHYIIVINLFFFLFFA